MKCANGYGEDLVVIPLSDLVVKGRGDDIQIVLNGTEHPEFGSLDLEAYKNDFYLAVDYSATDDIVALGVPVMIGVQDPESGSPMILGRRIVRGGKRYYLAAIFNGSFSVPEENSPGSFCLRAAEAVDPYKIFSERIKFEPGGMIYWNKDQLRDFALESE